jgi:hypothetical protein
MRFTLEISFGYRCRIAQGGRFTHTMALHQLLDFIHWKESEDLQIFFDLRIGCISEMLKTKQSESIVRADPKDSLD